VLTAVDLTLWRGPHCLFEQLSFEVTGGSALIVRGPNGSGKTSLLRVLCGLTRPEAGRVEWNGADVEKDRQGFGACLAYLGHATGLKADLTVEQNLQFCARMNGDTGTPWASCLDALDLGHCADLELRYLSAGQQRRAALARILMSEARLWIIDEPFTNLDDAGRAFVEERIASCLGGDGLAVIAAHHELNLGDLPARTIRLGAPA
jgi:heme exporter protein A